MAFAALLAFQLLFYSSSALSFSLRMLAATGKSHFVKLCGGHSINSTVTGQMSLKIAAFLLVIRGPKTTSNRFLLLSECQNSHPHT
jgi:hypothetical protein